MGKIKRRKNENEEKQQSIIIKIPFLRLRCLSTYILYLYNTKPNMIKLLLFLQYSSHRNRTSSIQIRWKQQNIYIVTPEMWICVSMYLNFKRFHRISNESKTRIRWRRLRVTEMRTYYSFSLVWFVFTRITMKMKIVQISQTRLKFRNRLYGLFIYLSVWLCLSISISMYMLYAPCLYARKLNELKILLHMGVHII